MTFNDDDFSILQCESNRMSGLFSGRKYMPHVWHPSLSALLFLKPVLHWYIASMLSMQGTKQNLLFLYVDCFKTDELITEAGSIVLQLWSVCSWYVSSRRVLPEEEEIRAYRCSVECCSLQITSAAKSLVLLVAIRGAFPAALCHVHVPLSLNMVCECVCVILDRIVET